MNFSFSNFIGTLSTFPKTLRFIKEHRVWSGFWKYGWIMPVLVLGGLLFSVRFYSVFIRWWSHVHIEGLADLGGGVRELAGDVAKTGSSLFFSSGFKYIVFILMEVVIFHSVHRTLEVLHGEKKEQPSFNIFLKAQIRMISVSIRSWILELIATIFISIAIGIIGFHGLKAPLVFFVQCYFIGFMMLDNYNEKLGMSIGRSLKFTRDFVGVALAIGLVVYAILHIPLAGAFLAPLIGGVTATLVMDKILHPNTNENYEYEYAAVE